MHTQIGTSSSATLTGHGIASALVEAMLPAGVDLPPADAETVCAQLADWLAEQPLLRASLTSMLLWLEGRSVLASGQRFSKASLVRRQQILNHLAQTGISSHLLRALSLPFKAAWLLDDGTQQRLGSRPRVQVPSQAETFRWQAQITSAADLGGDEALEADVVVIGTGAARGSDSIGWHLNYEGPDKPLLFLPESLYDKALPRAKSVVSRPQVQFSGVLTVNGEQIALDAWPGSENHNWGSRHTDQYAWGQVAAFDNMPDAFLECITARVRIGPLPSPWMSIACLRLGDEDLLFNRFSTAFRATGSYCFFHWTLATANEHGRLEVEMVAPREHFAALTYYNPPAGSKTCLNSKIASCTARLHRPGHPSLELTSRHGAAFEILTNRDDHGCPLLL